MEISPLIPIIGLFVIAANIVLAAVLPFSSPTVMGVQLFIAGMTTLIIAVVDLLNPIGIDATERFVLFFAGCINCSSGYYMVLLQIRRRGA